MNVGAAIDERDRLDGYGIKVAAARSGADTVPSKELSEVLLAGLLEYD